MITVIAGYLLGSIPFADLAARLVTGSSTTLRTHGSTNPGAANAIGVLGRRWGDLGDGGGQILATFPAVLPIEAVTAAIAPACPVT